MERKVKIKNYTSGMVSYTIANLHVKRTFMPNAIIEIPFNELEQGLYEYGIQTMFSDGILGVVKERDAIELGLEEGQGIVVALPADKSEVIAALKGPNGDLLKYLRAATPATKQLAGELAVTERIVDPGKIKIIEQQTGVNVLTALKRLNDLETPSADVEE